MPELEKRRLGQTDMYAKSLGLGCAYLGRSPVTDREAVEAVRRAIELGMDFLDTSPLYGESERRLGLALEGGLREKIYLETKTGTDPKRFHDFSAEATRWSVENSLQRLKTDYLDSVLIHDCLDIEDPLAPGRALDELLKMKEAGIIRHIGIGVRDHDFHRRAIETGQIEIVLTYHDYNLLKQSVAETTFPLAKKHDVGILLGSVLEVGKLAGPEPKDEPRAHAMWKWCRDRGVNIRDLAIQFCLAAPIDGIALVGVVSAKEVEEAYESATRDIPAEVWLEFKAEFGVGL